MFNKGEYLVEVLPYLKEFHSKTIVIKYGGSAMENDELKNSFCKDVSLLKYVGINAVIVHGGGKQIGDILEKLNIESTFHNGLRITSEEVMEAVIMVLAGKINKEIVLKINQMGGKAVGISGVDGNMIEARKKSSTRVDLGLVGEVGNINPTIIRNISSVGYIPVIAPIGFDESGKRYNINADAVASAVASALEAEKLIFLTDTDGVFDENKHLISTLSVGEAKQLMDSNAISGGMIPKITSAIDAIRNGVNKVHIINGTRKHSILEEIFTDAGIGTQIIL